jgi:hypothetical protein
VEGTLDNLNVPFVVMPHEPSSRNRRPKRSRDVGQWVESPRVNGPEYEIHPSEDWSVKCEPRPWTDAQQDIGQDCHGVLAERIRKRTS